MSYTFYQYNPINFIVSILHQKIKFTNPTANNFFPTLRKRVDGYFAENGIRKSGGKQLLFKAAFMLSLYLIPYFLILSNQFSGNVLIMLCIVMGLGVAGVGMSVMHDAIHGSLAGSALLNRILGASIYLLGGNAYNWEVQHNRLHHTFTNIHDVDEDITGKFLLRLSYGDKRQRFHRFQHIYAFGLYGLMTLSFLWKDFKEISLFNRLAKTGLTKPFPKSELIRLLCTKMAYVAFIMAAPLLLTDISFTQWLTGFLIMHITAGTILSTIFQMAHIVEGAEQPAVNEDGNIENAWAIHQLQTTSNFAGRNRALSWFIGGLDYQIEHHLFPAISHIHYHAISPIVRDTAIEFGLPYNAKENFNHALGSHIRALRKLGSH